MTLNLAIPEPDKVIDSTANLVKALTAAPAWFALFLAGAGLQALAYYEITHGCALTRPPAQAPAQPSAAPKLSPSSSAESKG